MALTAAQKSSLLYKHYLGAGSTRINREFFEEAIKSSFVVRPDQIWAYGEMIPNGDEVSGGEEAIAKIRALGDGEVFTWNKSESEKTYPIVKCYKDFRLTKVDDGTDSSFLIADENGNKIKELAKQEKKDGEDVKLTIDSNLQKQIYSQMKNDKGLFVVMNPKTGEILALVSTPSYDNNKMILGVTQEEWNEISNNEKKYQNKK